MNFWNEYKVGIILSISILAQLIAIGVFLVVGGMLKGTPWIWALSPSMLAWCIFIIWFTFYMLKKVKEIA